MAATIDLEIESGVFTGAVLHPHRGYYAGDFSTRPVSAGTGATTGDQPAQPAAAWRLGG